MIVFAHTHVTQYEKTYVADVHNTCDMHFIA